VQLVACSSCHTQYDVSDVVEKTFVCRCGETVENRPPSAVDAEIQRCGACGALVSATAESCAYCGSTIVRDDSRLLSLICPECYARNADDSRFCTACGVTFRPEAVRPDGHELPCPVCSRLMPPRQIGGVGINECGGCHGIWVPGVNFDVLVSRAIEIRKQAAPEERMRLKPRVSGSNPAAQQVRYRKCPECDELMLRKNFQKSSGVIIDRCSTHGTWLDADELEQIAGFILSGRGANEVSVEKLAVSEAFARVARASQRERNPFAGSDRPGGLMGSMVDILFDLLK